MNNQTVWVKDFFDNESNTFSYVVSDPISKRCAILDSVLNFDMASATTSTTHADQIIAFIQQHDLHVEWILETHVHADHISASQYLKSKLGGRVAISKKISNVQKTFNEIYHFDSKFINSNHQFDHLFEDHEQFAIGALHAYNIPTPGHTPACLSYVIGDVVFVGDTLFMPDYGTARCDFPQGSASSLFDSVQQLYQLPDQTRMYLCHDYLPEGRENFNCETTVLKQRQSNIHINQNTQKNDFVEMRTQRDLSLKMPKLILTAIQINMYAGFFPVVEANGISYLKIPMNYFK